MRGRVPRLWKPHTESLCGGTHSTNHRFGLNINHDSSMRTSRRYGMRERPINTCGLACAGQGQPRAALDAGCPISRRFCEKWGFTCHGTLCKQMCSQLSQKTRKMGHTTFFFLESETPTAHSRVFEQLGPVFRRQCPRFLHDLCLRRFVQLRRRSGAGCDRRSYLLPVDVRMTRIFVSGFFRFAADDSDRVRRPCAPGGRCSRVLSPRARRSCPTACRGQTSAERCCCPGARETFPTIAWGRDARSRKLWPKNPGRKPGWECSFCLESGANATRLRFPNRPDERRFPQPTTCPARAGA